MKVGDLVQNQYRPITMVGIIMGVNHLPLIGPITGQVEPEVYVLWCPIDDEKWGIYRPEDLEVINEDW